MPRLPLSPTVFGADLSIRDSMRGLTPLKKAKRSLDSASGRAEIAECVQILEAAGKAGREVAMPYRFLNHSITQSLNH